MKIINVVGARPNFIKIAPFINEMKKHREVESLLIHTGQHYDYKMARIFFKELDIPRPNYNLKVGSGSHAKQTAKIMERLEPVLLKEKASLVMVVGDVNSTLAAALVAVKLGIKIGHIEAGLRSFDREMPEEINRILVDQLSDYLFITEEDALKNLLKEGIDKKKIFFVGNIMIDTLISKLNASHHFSQKSGGREDYGVVTLHRPSNVDKKAKLEKLIRTISRITKEIKVVFPMHPRTKKMIKRFGLQHYLKNVEVTEPMGYLGFLAMVKNSMFVMTDSGGLAEETTFLGIPCLTLRQTTERPVTVKLGTNVVVGDDGEKIKNIIAKIRNGSFKKGTIPPLWDGKTAQRIVKILLKEHDD